MLYFHVTHNDYTPSILLRGLDPGLAQGKRKVIWLSDAQLLHWAIKHVGKASKWPLHLLAVLAIDRYPDQVCQMRRGIYISHLWIPPECISVMDSQN